MKVTFIKSIFLSGRKSIGLGWARVLDTAPRTRRRRRWAGGRGACHIAYISRRARAHLGSWFNVRRARYFHPLPAASACHISLRRFHKCAHISSGRGGEDELFRGAKHHLVSTEPALESGVHSSTSTILTAARAAADLVLSPNVVAFW